MAAIKIVGSKHSIILCEPRSTSLFKYVLQLMDLSLDLTALPCAIATKDAPATMVDKCGSALIFSKLAHRTHTFLLAPFFDTGPVPQSYLVSYATAL